MEISAIEISLLTKRIASAIAEYFLSGIYSIEGGALLRFNHSTKAEKLVAVSPFAPWLTTKNLALPQATKFVSHLRDAIERSDFKSLEQIGNERIARFSFENRKGDRTNLYAEFFSHGNIVLTDAMKNDSIIEVENPQTFRHRKILVGERYVLPPSRGIALQDVNKNTLISIFHESIESPEERDISAIKWFGRRMGTSRKFVEEIFKRSHANPTIPLLSLNDEIVSNLANACSELRNELEESNMGYILMPAEESDIDPDVCPIVPHSWKVLVERKLATIQNYPSLSEALDEVQIQALVLTKRRKASLEARAKAEELASALSKQVSQVEWNRNTSRELRTLAGELIHATDDTIDPNVIQKLHSYRLIEVPTEAPNQFRFVTTPRSFLGSFKPNSLASRLFDEAKRLEETNLRLVRVMKDLEEQKKTLLQQTVSLEERAGRKLVTERRERQWYERYRWFVSSDGRLIVGGRDATSNSIMINKYTDKNDVVFHADLHGSPFFILRNVGARKEPAYELALELAQATVSFSKAWKDELGSADAFWVFGDQVKKSAPSGEYLSRGSFFIEGKKNFVRHVKVELSVGITTELPREESTSKVAEQYQVAIVCGPDKSLARNCVSRVRISPGKERASDFGKRVKQHLISRIKDERVSEAAKKLTIDEIIRVLPAGGYKLVSDR